MAIQLEQRVTLRLPGRPDGIAAKVEEASERVVRLVLDVPAKARGLHDERAVLEYTTPRGVHRVSGELEPGDVQTGVVVLRRDHDVDDDVVQRRDFARVPAAVPVSVTITHPVRGAASTTTLNLSAGGLSFVDPIGIPTGIVVDIDIDIAAGNAPVRARGAIVRTVGEEAKGVRIDSISRDDRERLVRYVTQRQRATVQIAKGG